MTALDTSTVHEGQGRSVVLPDADDAPSSPLDDLRSGIGAWLQLGVSLGERLDRQERTTRSLMDKLQKGTPVDLTVAAAGAYPGAGALLLNFGTPDQGTRWEVTNIVVGGADADTAAAGTAGLYVSGLVPQGGQRAAGGLTNCVDIAKTLPNVAFYGTRQLVVNDQEYLFLVILAGTPAQTYAAQMSATVFNIAAAEGKDITVL